MAYDIVKFYLAIKKNPVKVHNTKITLKKMAASKKSISRFGDGEFNLILGNSIPYQKATLEISVALRNILRQEVQSEDCLIGIPYAIQSLSEFNLKSRVFWLKYLAKHWNSISPQLDNNYYYWDSQVSRIYINRLNRHASRKYFDEWKNIWKNKRLLLVEGEYSRFGVGNDLLNGAKRVERILCPSIDAFGSYKKIYSSIVDRAENFDLVILVLGPTASVLSFELSKLGIWALDCGNMDMEYEWMSMGTGKPEPVKNKYTIEVKSGTNVGVSVNKRYLSQIILKIDL